MPPRFGNQSNGRWKKENSITFSLIFSLIKQNREKEKRKKKKKNDIIKNPRFYFLAIQTERGERKRKEKEAHLGMMWAGDGPGGGIEKWLVDVGPSGGE